MSTGGIDDFQYMKKYCIWIKKKAKYRYLAFSVFISVFGDIFLRLHLRDLCYTGRNESKDIERCGVIVNNLLIGRQMCNLLTNYVIILLDSLNCSYEIKC